MNDAHGAARRGAAAAATRPVSTAGRLRCRRNASIAPGVAHVDYRAVAALAAPLMLNSSLQAVISLTDTWFVGHISTTAMAGMAAVYWVILLFLMLIGGVGLAVQTFVAQARGQPATRTSEPCDVGRAVGERPHVAAVRGARVVRRHALRAVRARARSSRTGDGVLATAHARRTARRRACGPCSAFSTVFRVRASP